MFRAPVLRSSVAGVISPASSTQHGNNIDVHVRSRLVPINQPYYVSLSCAGHVFRRLDVFRCVLFGASPSPSFGRL